MAIKYLKNGWSTGIFHTQPSLRFIKNGPKKKICQVSGSCVDENALLMSEVREAFLIHYSSFTSLLAVTVGEGWLMQLRSCFFFHLESTSTVVFTLLNYNNDTFFRL